jgi:hypothetical protein
MPTQMNQRSSPRWRITERDVAIVVGAALEQLPTRQIARWFFDSPRTATNRVATLIELGYMEMIHIPGRAPAIVAATPNGARARADLRLPPKAHAPGRFLHDLAVRRSRSVAAEQDLQADSHGLPRPSHRNQSVHAAPLAPD